jgi:hypothetical protein
MSSILISHLVFCYSELWVMVLMFFVNGLGVGIFLSILLSCGFLCLVLFGQHHLSVVCSALPTF